VVAPTPIAQGAGMSFDMFIDFDGAAPDPDLVAEAWDV
jgi:hypothetical protein